MNKDLFVLIEAPSQQLFTAQYPEIISVLNEKSIEVNFKRDGVTFGPGEDLVIAGLVFVYQSVISGITWDIIKDTITKIIKNLAPDKRKKVYVYFENKQTKERIKVVLNDQDPDMIEIKGKLKISFK